MKRHAFYLAFTLQAVMPAKANMHDIEKHLNKIQKEIQALHKPIAKTHIGGRLAQANVHFSKHHYGKVLSVIEPVLTQAQTLNRNKQNKLFALAAHSYFELGNYVQADQYFKKLPDQTSLYRRVQIANHFGNFKTLQSIYSKIKNPPDFVRYIYGRQLFLQNKFKKAKRELSKLKESPKYKERASYILATIFLKEGGPHKAQDLFESTSKSSSPELAKLSKLATARVAYMQDKPEQAIAIYQELDQPEELAQAHLLAGDLQEDTKEAKRFYKKARKISSNWISEQPEVQELKNLHQKINVLKSRILKLEVAYNRFEIRNLEALGFKPSKIINLAKSLQEIQKKLSEATSSKMHSVTQINLGKLEHLQEKIFLFTRKLSLIGHNYPERMRVEFIEAQTRLNGLQIALHALEATASSKAEGEV